MDEFNFNISKFEFFDENKPFFDPSKKFHMHFKEKYKEPKFYFLVKDNAMQFNCKSFYNENDYDDNNEGIKEENEEIELRKNVEDGKYFKVIIQTYNHLIKDVEVYPEMTIGELKDIIEK